MRVMNRDNKRARDLARLEEAQRRTQDRLEQQRARIDRRFARMRDRLGQKYGETSSSQQRIVAAALELLKEDGLNNLSLRKLATKIDMQAPALYWHFQNKEVLVDYMAEAILEKEFKDLKPRQENETWQDWLINHMIRLRRAMLAYPDGARVVAGAHLYPAITLARSLECGLISLTSAGVSLKTARQLMTTATTYTFGYVIEEQAAPTAEQMAEFDLDAFLEPFPHMAKAITDDDRSMKGQDEDYLIGLRYIVNGGAPR